MRVSMNYLLIAFLLLIVLSASKALGQGEVQNFYLKDGTSIQGRIVAQDDSTLLVETKYGTLEIRRMDILKHETMKQFTVEPQNEKTKTIRLEDGTVIKGTVVSESEDSLTVETAHGMIALPKASIVSPFQKEREGEADQSRQTSGAKRMMLYESKKKSPAKAAFYSCLLPGIGHSYAGNRERGLVFGLVRLGFLLLATEVGWKTEMRGWQGITWEETEVTEAFYIGIAGYAIVGVAEMFDAANEAKKYNKRLLQEISPELRGVGMSFIPSKDGSQLRVSYRF